MQTYSYTHRILRPKVAPGPNSTIFLLVIFTWAQFHLKLVGFFFLSQACRIKPVGSQQTTTDVIRSLVLQDIHTDHCRGRGSFFFVFFFCLHRLAQLSEDITLAFLWSVSYQKLNKPDGAVFWLKVTEQTTAWMLFLFKDGNRITNLLHRICIFLWKGGAPKRNFSQVPFLLRISNKIENKRKVGWLTTWYMKLAREWGGNCQLWQWQTLSRWHSDNPYSPCDQINIHSWFPDSFHTWCNTWKNFWPGFWHFHLFWEYF